MKKLISMILSLCLLLSFAAAEEAPATKEPAEMTAEELYEAGKEAFDAKEYEKALESFLEAKEKGVAEASDYLERMVEDYIITEDYELYPVFEFGPEIDPEEELPETWKCGDFSYIVLEDGTAEIYCYLGEGGEAVIPKEVDGRQVTRIGFRAFQECRTVTSVTIPEGVTEIGEDAFFSCYALESVTIPESVKSIGEYAFYWCSALTSVTIPEGVTRIESDTFSRCSSLTSIVIPDGVEVIGRSAFCDCKALTSVTIPDSVRKIRNSAFNGCEALASVTIPEGVIWIGKMAFYNCYALTSVTIPESMTSLNDSVFSRCYSLASVTVPASVTSIGECVFREDEALTVRAPAGSAAEEYCRENGIRFERLE